MATLTLVAVSPKVNPDRMFVKVTPEANYVNGTPDTFNLAAIADPEGIGQIPLNNPPLVTPGIFNENMSGYYSEVQKQAAPTLQNYGMRYFQPGGTEVSSGATPSQITGGELVLEIVVPTDQQD